LMAGVPAIVVGDHRHGRIADLGLAGELGLRHIGHADYIAPPSAVKLALCPRRELRSFDNDIRAAALCRRADDRSSGGERVADATADRMRDRDMRNAARPEKTF